MILTSIVTFYCLINRKYIVVINSTNAFLIGLRFYYLSFPIVSITAFIIPSFNVGYSRFNEYCALAIGIGFSFVMRKTLFSMEYSLRKHGAYTPIKLINETVYGLPRTSKTLSKGYDIFVSYKSEDAMIVRIIVEQLLSEWTKTWFAEYNIPINEREMFQNHIDDGITDSKYGVCFTNTLYAQSEYCELEYVKMLKDIGIDNIFDVRLPDDPQVRNKYPDLNIAKSISWNNDINDLIRFISTSMKCPTYSSTIPYTPVPEKRKNLCYRNAIFSLDFSNWIVTEFNNDGRLDNDGSMDAASFVQTFGNFHIAGNLQVGRDVYTSRIASTGILDDRKVYLNILDFAKTFLSDSGEKCVGVHLLFHSGLSHAAFTSYRTGGFWFRRYSLVLPSKNSNSEIEFVFTFGMKAPFHIFCKYAYNLDYIVSSLECSND